MQINNNYQLYPKAIQDIKLIYLYSLHHFGKKIAENYIKKIEKSFQSVTSEPNIARKCDYVSKKLRAINVESHVIFFKIIKNQPVIIRVLHKSMDFIRHL